MIQFYFIMRYIYICYLAGRIILTPTNYNSGLCRTMFLCVSSGLHHWSAGTFPLHSVFTYFPQIGDRVFTVRTTSGSYAEFCVADDDLTFHQGSAVRRGSPRYSLLHCI